MRDLETIRKAMRESGLSFTQLSKAIGIHRQSVYNVISGRGKNPKYETIYKINAWLDLTK